MASRGVTQALLAAAASLFFLHGAEAATCIPRGDPFKIIDPQHWVNPDNMTWVDFKAPPGTQWNDPSRKGSDRNFNIALVTMDYADMPFVVTGAANSTIFGNPLPEGANIARDQVPAFFRDLLNKPGELNKGHTLHEYWMEDSEGKFGVDLTSFGPYRMPALSYQYGVEDDFNPDACPGGKECGLSIRTDALKAWRDAVGNETASSFELVFLLSAGQDESSTWQEFGEMKFASKEDVPESFGPPAGTGGNATLPNYAKTRYVPWSSWASASTIWPNAGGGSSVQCESSGMGTYAHELSHLLNIGDNYNNPYGIPPRRSYTGPWSMLSRGSFNGPGGPHSRWHIPAMQGGALGSLHTVRDKLQIGLISNSSIANIPKSALSSSGIAIAHLTARSVKSNLMALRVEMGTDQSPKCDPKTDLYCDGGGYNNYDLEVVDRMGADSFQADAGVMISKTKNVARQPFQWTIDANPQDIELVDFIRPNGSAAMITLGDYRQLLDALFHAGSRSGSKFEHKDAPNGLHFYILNKVRNKDGELSYSVAARSLTSTNGSKHGVKLDTGHPVISRTNTPTGKGVFCSFALKNDGTYAKGSDTAENISKYFGSDVYRLKASVKGRGWRVEIPNELIAAKYGETVSANVAVGATANAEEVGVVTLTAVSESDSDAKAVAECRVSKA